MAPFASKIITSEGSVLHTLNRGGNHTAEARGSLSKVQGSLLFVTYTIIQGIISSEM